MSSNPPPLPADGNGATQLLPSRISSAGRRILSTCACCATKSDNNKNNSSEMEYDVFVCKASVFVVTVQCVFYSIFYVAFTTAGFVIASTDISGNNSTSTPMNTSSPNCTSEACEAARNQVSTGTLFLSAALYAVMYLVQFLLLVICTVLVRRPPFQRRWTAVSTTLLVVATVFGPVFLNSWTATLILTGSIDPLMLNASPSMESNMRGLFLNSVLLIDNQRYSGLSALSLLAFAPRFKPFLIVSAVLAVYELISEAISSSLVYEYLTRDSEDWTSLMSHFSFSLFSQPVFCVVVSYAVPVGFLWLFERMLRNSFALQQMLKQRSNLLFKQANPFDVTTIRDWVTTLSGSDSVTVTMAESRARSSISMRENPSRIHRKHPWELQAEALSLGSVIGAGSHGQVYRGMYKGSEVAVKTLLILPEDTRASGALSDRIFEETASEAQALSLLRHENMMRFFGICFLQQTRTIAMVTELCKCDLRAWIDETHGHTDNEIWEVALQIAKGLVYLHEDAGMVHRDLKPSNILLTRQNVIKLCDFGISVTNSTGNSGSDTGIVGTVEYMAPECFRSELGSASTEMPVKDPLAKLRPIDVYAFGCIAWELFAQRQIWDNFVNNRDGIVQAVLSGERPDLLVATFRDSGSTESMRTLVAKCWSADPSQRPSAGECVHSIYSLDPSSNYSSTAGQNAQIPRAVTEVLLPSAQL
eukprot:INCI4607.1.p1 GENE.INCI4607.1~~INCI4607.1.p1  ORF type:complete len:702 (-),score=75.12 INCI4607.1:1396-3501(-)